MTARPILLKVLLRQRHWQPHATFCDEYDKAARTVDARLVGSWPSRAQFHRWLSGELRGLPYSHHCRVLEQMFPGWRAAALFAACPDDVAAMLDAPVVADPGDASGSALTPLSQGIEWERYPVSAGESVRLLESLTGADLGDDAGVMRAVWAPSAAPTAIMGYLFGTGPGLVTGEHEPARGAAAVAAIRTTTAHLTDLDFTFGGGYTRRMLLFYFRSDVVPVLRASHPERTRREIFSAAAEVAQLIGWSAYDAGRHGAAQRYFVQGLRLAREADDHMLGATILSNLSHQANYLGRFADAAQLARAAQSETLGRHSPTVMTLLLAMEARALASSGDERECAAVLNRAEKVFARRDPGSEPKWIEYFNAEELAGEAAHCFRDLGRSEETQVFAAQAIEPTNTPPRTRAFIGMVAAAGVLKEGDVDGAVGTAVRAVDLAGPLQSDRYLRYLTDFYASLTARVPKSAQAATFADCVHRHYPALDLARTG